MSDATMLTDALKARFDELGYVILRGVIDDGIQANVRRDLSWLVNLYAGKLIEQGLTHDPYLARRGC